ncbi:MAG: hypothetical protein RI894_2524, partial [Bacteroidota bacterium]
TTTVENALNFDGADDFVNLGTELGNFGTNDFTVELSLKTTNPSQFIIAKRPVCAHASFWNLSIANGSLVFEIDNDGSGRHYAAITAPTPITDGDWHHIAIVRAATLVSLYIDGILIEVKTTTVTLFRKVANVAVPVPLPPSPAIINLNNTAPLYLGKNGACGGRSNFDGSLDELRIWNTARSIAEIIAYKNEAVPPTAPDLLAYYPCNQGAAEGNNAAITTLTDVSLRKKNGILTNFALTGARSNWTSNYNTIVSTAVGSTSTATYIPPAGEEPTLPLTGLMTDADAELVLKWIAKQVAAAKIDYCYRQSYGRGVGSPLSACPPDKEKDGLLCYPRCRANYNGVGPVCWQNCPSGFTDLGGACAKPSAGYGRGTGRVPDVSCPKGYSQRGIGAAAWCDNGPTYPWNLKTKEATISCRGDEERNGGLCYPKCKEGYAASGCCICSPVCPPGMTDTGFGVCTKNSYPRTAGTPMVCANGRDEDAGLCYTSCRPGYHGVGPVCWQSCPATQPFDCVSGCARNQAACAEKTANMAISPVIMVASIMSLGEAGIALNASKAAIMTSVRAANKVGARAAAKAATRQFVDAFEALTTKKVLQTMKNKLNPSTVEWICAKFGQANLVVSMSNDFDRNDLWLLAGLDPTGAASVVEAYLQKKCDIEAPFPTLSRSYK